MNFAPFRKALVALALVAVLLPTAAPSADANQTSHITIRTFGWGHGVGMGQWGAEGMARGGSSYQQILNHYYTNTAIENASTNSNWNDVRVQIRTTNDPVEIRIAESGTRLAGPSGSDVNLNADERVRVDRHNDQMRVRVLRADGSTRVTRSGPNNSQTIVHLNGNRANTLSAAWGDTPYRNGRIVVHGEGSEQCTQRHCVVVRGMTMNQYLHGLVEVPGSWHTNSLRAQAVAARSFAAPKVNHRGPRYDLVDSVLDQAYRGSNGTGGGWPQAVNDTNNQVLVYRGSGSYHGQIISAYYSASTGGHTENSEYVWSAAMPWARGLPDPGDSISPHRSTFTIAADDLSRWLRDAPDVPEVRNITDVRIVGNIGVSGRSNKGEVRITGNTTVTISSNRFRQIVNANAGSNRQINTFNYRIDSSGLGTTGDQITTATGVALADVGYWVTNSQGAVSARDFAPYHGSMAGQWLRAPVLGMAANPNGTGYWLVASDGGIFTFGNAAFHGSTGNMWLNQPVVGMASTDTGRGYWLVARDGGIFSFGDARFHGSTGAIRLNQPVVGMARTADGNGYWLVARDGGLFAFGNAGFHGSVPGLGMSANIVAMAPTPSGRGYWMLDRNGGVFSFGDAGFHGSLAGSGKQAVGLAPTRTGGGYVIVASDGTTYRYGDA